MFDVDINNIITITRGDSGSLILFLNKGTQLNPIPFILQDGLPIGEYGATIVANSKLNKGSIIAGGSVIMGSLYSETTTLEDDVTILDDGSNTTLVTGSFIIYNSIIRKNCIINNKTVTESFYVGRDEVYLGVTEPNQPFEKAILKKKYNSDNQDKESGDIDIRFEHEDTTLLLPGRYYYTIKAKFINKYNTFDVNTVIQNTEFNIQE